jgi:hypothetical protein
LAGMWHGACKSAAAAWLFNSGVGRPRLSDSAAERRLWVKEHCLRQPVTTGPPLTVRPMLAMSALRSVVVGLARGVLGSGPTQLVGLVARHRPDDRLAPCQTDGPAGRAGSSKELAGCDPHVSTAHAPVPIPRPGAAIVRRRGHVRLLVAERGLPFMHVAGVFSLLQRVHRPETLVATEPGTMPAAPVTDGLGDPLA